MKKVFYFLLCVSVLSCGSDITTNSCFQNTIAPITLDLSNPQLNGLITPNGTATIAGGLKGIVLFNKGTGGSFTPYVALDRECPNRDCAAPMIVNAPILECSCDGSKYSLLNGSLVSGESDCSGGARRYTVIQNGNSIQITN
ncbi:Rieske (2Fe-2S) protein [Tenacibaculum holothuriorum]|uniref:Rieske (2Fe-2S) protein n=1 Tax=Tenacibaculum holothuriorum TaxID=1635173 RepID=UPI000A32301C|nr:hypothetical protein [Tenacibaculum holothuriorum]